MARTDVTLKNQPAKRSLYDYSFITNQRSYKHGTTNLDQPLSLNLDTNKKDSIVQVKNVVFKARNENRVVMFVFDKCPLTIADDKTYTTKVPATVLPSHVAELTKNLFALAVNRYGKRVMSLPVQDVNPIFSHSTSAQQPNSMVEYLNNTTYVFTYFYGYQDHDGKFSEPYDSASARFVRHCEHYKPNIIVSIGDGAYTSLRASSIKTYTRQTLPAQFYGRLIPTTTNTDQFIVPCLDFTKALYGEGTYIYSSLLGHSCRSLLTALLGRQAYSIVDGVQGNSLNKFFDETNYRSLLVDTVEKFDKLIAVIKTKPHVAVDTETANLNRVKNKLLTIQFSFNSKTGYVIPIQHFESPFSPKELKHITTTLRDYFEGNNSNEYHIYTNAVFDLNVLRSALDIRFFYNDVWDIFAGDFCLDENAKFLKNATGSYYYSLLSLSLSYGTDVYLTAEFSKEQRATIVSSSLTKDLIEYCCLDVVVPFAIHLAQKQKAQDIGYLDDYEKVVRHQVSDMIHTFSCMESHGTHVDVDYLLSLRAKDSPISKEIAKLELEIVNTPEGQTANKTLLKQAGIPSKGLFGVDRDSQILLSLRKREHLHMLFFDILDLKQDNVGKTGIKKLDAAFQKQHSNVPLVSMYTNLTKAKKVSNAYVKSLLRFWQNDEDFRQDKRIRPHYNFTGVVTGRTSASKPSLQQIPGRTTLGKLIKRLFIAEPNNLYIKVDFCLTGSTLITTSEGLVRLDSLCKNRIVGSTETLQDISVIGAKGKAPAVSCTYTGFKSTLRITAKSGNSISCTGNHKVLVLRDGRLQWVEAENCVLGDYLCLPSQQMVRETHLSLSLSDSIELNRNNSTGYTNVCKDRDTYFVKIKNGESYDIIRGGFKTAEDAAKARDRYYASHGLSGNRSRVELLRPLEMTPDLAYILGCIVSDGYITTHEKYNHLFFYNTDTAFLDKFIQCLFNVFGYQASRSRIGLKGNTRNLNGTIFTHTKDFWSVRVRSNQIVTWLVELGVYSQHGRKNGKTQSHYQHVPWSILQADKKSQMSFLAAYLEADGEIRNSTHNICWDSTSYKVICGLRAILNSHGFITSLTGVRRNTKSLHLGREDSQLFWKEIEPFMVSKKLDAYVGGRISRLGKLPGKYVTYWESKGVNMLKIQKRGYFFTPIIGIRDNGQHHVYDLTVDAGHSPSFTANGIIVHNCAHEVRNWAIVSSDQEVAKLFYHGLKLQETYKKSPTSELATKIEFEADVHKLNASFFFGVKTTEVTKELRDSVKGVIFGLIYGLGVNKMATQVKRTKEETLDLMKRFSDKFKVGWEWFDQTKKFAQSKLYVQSPLGRRRNLFNYLVPEGTEMSNSLHGAGDRRAVNSLIQGFSSDQAIIGARVIERLKWDHFCKTGRMPNVHINNMVHDSVEVEVSYEDFFTGLKYIDYAMTQGVKRVLHNRCQYDISVDLDIDFEIGADARGLEKWNNSYESLLKCLKKALEFQKTELLRNIDPEKTLANILSRYKDGPAWLINQIDSTPK